LVVRDALFVDTSIQIARLVHSPETKQRIRTRLARHREVVTSLVVQQEFKRRLLKEARYLLGLFDQYDSFGQVLRHVQEKLPPQQSRKQNICLATLLTIDEMDEDQDRTDRARCFLRSLLRDGTQEFEASIQQVLADSNCACAQQPIRRKGGAKGDFDFGTDKCARTGDACGIVEFLINRREVAGQLLAYLQGLQPGQKTEELSNAEAFLTKVIADPSAAIKANPCLEVGDLIIALESAGIATFYTLNWRESQHLCRPLGQRLIIRPKNSDREDVVWEPGAEWSPP
jgi:hypothetical protein